MTALLSLLVVVALSLLVTRIATVALTLTGLSKESARFQARSAFTGSGFTTSESEAVVRHPVRRRIVMVLMLLGNAGIVAVVGSFLLTFIEAGQPGQWLPRIAVLAAGLLLIGALATSSWVDRQISRLTTWALRRYTELEVRDYSALLHLAGEYKVVELEVRPGDWLADQTLGELDLRKEGLMVLGVQRPDGAYVGVPRGGTRVEAGDVLVVYGRTSALAELDRRRAGHAGEVAHQEAVVTQDGLARQEGRQAPSDGPMGDGTQGAAIDSGERGRAVSNRS